jgi:hypothetical protein
MTQLEILLKKVRKLIPNADLIEETSGEITILTRLVLEKDELQDMELSHNEKILRNAFTDCLLPTYVEPTSPHEDFESTIKWDFGI